ncbi:transposase IS4 family protein [Alicycliphilus sp. B1]|uniref:Transposase IS4 family protein n=1 Tax=Alicycliphilus denitrificans (strain DSM 14773 / CIP 107495 / K601) TaxID=596154 RepID=F4GEP0_ALIDK|nr:transposase IS4 family protein [Alicycliphilus denitrificans BC]AEB83842.1 transposase IS4 family protein [Alicycliphilus denitrificans K601]GAO24238.1 transposase IS4 family protein [Alicycliphilus sp. B1]
MSTKIHLANDGQGRPLRLILTPGQVNDITQAPELLRGFAPTHVLADKGYDSRALVAQIEACGAQAVIPPRSCQQARPFDAKLYRARNAIERCFGRLKQYRRIATRYDRKDAHFMAFLCLAASLTWVPD